VISSRFFRLWLLWSAVYLLLAVLGPNGPRPSWPHISQHLLQARAWAGSDIRFLDGSGREKIIRVSPRLDVTPYFAHRIVEDPRENTVISNIAVRLPGRSGRLIPAQDAFDAKESPAPNFRCDVGFPPGPSFLLFPLVLLLGSSVATGWIGPLVGALAVASIDGLFSILAPKMGMEVGAHFKNALSLLAGGGTLMLLAAPAGGTFLFAQTVGVAGLSLALLLAARGCSLPASLAFGLAITSRPAMVGAVGLYLLLGITAGGIRSIKGRFVRLLSLLSGPALLSGITLLLNQLRFGSPFLFGYHAMLVPPFLRQRLAEHGQLSLAYLAHNASWVLIHPPELLKTVEGALRFPFLVSDPRGMGLLFVTPAYLALGASLRFSDSKGRLIRVLSWISLLLCCLPGLLYYNTGWVQWGGRFLLDAWPMFILLTGLGLARMSRRWVWTLVLASMIATGWGAILIATGVWPGCCS